jgi:hypothetical protein
MVYNAATDFLGLWRASGGNVSKMEMPGLDFVISALARAGVITVSVSATAPVANQSITAWLRAAVPSYSAEGAFFLWDKVTTNYLAATPALFLQFLEATAGENGVSWWTSTGGPPLNTVGNNGDFAIRTDSPGGFYGPKVAGAWPVTPIPGTVDTVTSTSLDNAFGATPGQIIRRGAAAWEALAIGAANQLLSVAAGLPEWATLSALMDTLFGTAQGSVMYRDVGAWDALPPGVANQVLASGGPGANPAWAARSAEFPSGTRMLFQQSAAPTGWTKDITLTTTVCASCRGGGQHAGQRLQHRIRASRDRKPRFGCYRNSKPQSRDHRNHTFRHGIGHHAGQRSRRGQRRCEHRHGRRLGPHAYRQSDAGVR